MNTPRLTEIELLTIEEMNRGMYLFQIGTIEGIGPCSRIATNVKKGTVENLLQYGLIRLSEHAVHNGERKSISKRYLLTDEGRKYRRVEK